MENHQRSTKHLNNLTKNRASVPQEMRQEYLLQQKTDTAAILTAEKYTIPLETHINADSSVSISPKRGATIPSLILEGVEIFYNDPQKRNDLTQSVREGFFMGPQAGPFSPAQNEAYGYNLKQHGFLRDVLWSKKEETEGAIAYGFSTTPETNRQFPYDFGAIEKIAVSGNKARIALQIHNTSDQEMPFAPGHHTYYKVSPEAKKDIQLSENMGISDEDKVLWLDGEKTLKLDNPGRIQVFIPGTGLLQIDIDPKFKDIRLRSQKGAGFICIEPVVCHPGVWESESIHIPAGQKIELGFSITLLEKDKK